MNRESLVPGRGGAWYSYAKEDVPAGIVVFLVAVPLCLGIAQASGAPPLAGLLAGIVGGLVVPLVSRSPLSVSGPAAGLTVLVAAAIKDLGYPGFLLAVLVAGFAQILLGLMRAGLIAHFLPSSVIKGMLAAIGLLIVLKQLPHAVGFDADFEGDESFTEADGHNTLTAILDAWRGLTVGAVAVAAAAALAAWLWPRVQAHAPKLRLLPVPLVTVLAGVLAAKTLGRVPLFALDAVHFVNLPVFHGLGDVQAALVLPDFSLALTPQVWTHGITLAIVASIETLLSLEAADGLDRHRRISPTNRELVAQGLGNACSGLMGGIPVTSVIVRTSANAQAGGKTRLSAFVHGAFLLGGLLFLAPALNSVPLAALAVVLIKVGLNLSSPALWRSMWKGGAVQFTPFVVTVLAILFTDLLRGTLLGAAVGLGFMVRAQQKNAMIVTKDQGSTLITFAKDITFLQKSQLKELLRSVPDHSYLGIDRRRVAFVDHDVEEILDDFVGEAATRGVTVEQHFEPGGEQRRTARLLIRQSAPSAH